MNDALLDDLDQAARTAFSDEELADATARFRQSLSDKHPAGNAIATPSRRFLWLKLSGALASAFLVVSVLTLMLPGTSSSTAFAQALAWFDSYETMHLELLAQQDRGQGVQTLYEMDIRHERGGVTRIDIDPMTQWIDPVRGKLVIALPGGQVMHQDLPVKASPLSDLEELAWLDELRKFQGQADLLDERRDFGGIAAQGWRLELSGIDQTLWVDPENQQPIQLDGQLAGGVTLTVDFAFNEVFAPELLSAPEAE